MGTRPLRAAPGHASLSSNPFYLQIGEVADYCGYFTAVEARPPQHSAALELLFCFLGVQLRYKCPATKTVHLTTLHTASSQEDIPNYCHLQSYSPTTSSATL